MKKAFTLLELLIVLLIAGILATIAVVKYDDVRRRIVIAEAYSFLGSVKSVQEIYYSEYETYSKDIARGSPPEYVLDVEFPPQVERYFEYGVELGDYANLGDPGSQPTTSDKYTAAAWHDVVLIDFPERPHIHDHGGTGIWLDENKVHSHGQFEHAHPYNQAPEQLPE